MDDTRTRPADAQSLDATLGLLRDPRRRHVVAVLAERTAPIGLRELAAAVAAREPGTRPQGPPGGTSDEATAGGATAADANATPDRADDAIAEVAATLHHVHLPKLADAGVLAYDSAARRITSIRTAELLSSMPAVGDDDR